jgi:hypothetical protein
MMKLESTFEVAAKVGDLSGTVQRPRFLSYAASLARKRQRKVAMSLRLLAYILAVCCETSRNAHIALQLTLEAPVARLLGQRQRLEVCL